MGIRTALSAVCPPTPNACDSDAHTHTRRAHTHSSTQTHEHTHARTPTHTHAHTRARTQPRRGPVRNSPHCGAACCTTVLPVPAPSAQRRSAAGRRARLVCARHRRRRRLRPRRRRAEQPDVCAGRGPAGRDGPFDGRSLLPRQRRDWAHPCSHLHRDWAHPCHICTETGLAPAASAGHGAWGLAVHNPDRVLAVQVRTAARAVGA